MTVETTLPMSARRGRQKKRVANAVPGIARVLLGFFLLASGMAGLLHLTPPPPPAMPHGAAAFSTALMQSGYMMPLIFGTQTVVGALLLLNRFVPLALTLLAPFLVNAFAFHLFLMPQGLVMVALFVVLELYLAWSYRQAFLPLLSMRVRLNEPLVTNQPPLTAPSPNPRTGE